MRRVRAHRQPWRQDENPDASRLAAGMSAGHRQGGKRSEESVKAAPSRRSSRSALAGWARFAAITGTVRSLRAKGQPLSLGTAT